MMSGRPRHAAEIYHSLVILMGFRVLETQKVLESVGVYFFFNFVLICFIVTSVWTFHNHSRNPKYEKNFKTTNKLALKEKATTARAQSAFRNTFHGNLPRI